MQCSRRSRSQQMQTLVVSNSGRCEVGSRRHVPAQMMMLSETREVLAGSVIQQKEIEMTMFDIATANLAPRWTPTRIVRSGKKEENAELVEFGQTILNIELSDISASPLVKETGMWMRSSFARDRNIMTFKDDMLDRYRHLGDTLSGGDAPALRVFGGEHADGFSGIDMHIRFKRHDGSFGTLGGLLAFLPLDTDDAEECFQLFSYNPIEPKTLVHVNADDFAQHVIEACAREATR